MYVACECLQRIHMFVIYKGHTRPSTHRLTHPATHTLPFRSAFRDFPELCPCTMTTSRACSVFVCICTLAYYNMRDETAVREARKLTQV